MSSSEEVRPTEDELRLLKKAEAYPGYVDAVDALRIKLGREPSFIEKVFIGRDAFDRYLIQSGKATREEILQLKREIYSQPSPQDIKR